MRRTSVWRTPRNHPGILRGLRLAPAGIGSAMLTLLAATTAVAGEAKFTPPQGCTAFATVQHKGCTVSQHYTCEGDPAGYQWSLYMDADGPFFASLIDSETRWIESHDLDSGGGETLQSETDPASFTELLATGTDTYDFTQAAPDGTTTRYVGVDRLTGETIDVSGITMERTEFDISAFDAEGGLLWRRKGNDLIQREWRLFFGDRESFENSYGDTEESVSTPMTVAHPGDKGFLSAKPEFDCDMMMTRAPLPQATPQATENDHDQL